MLFDRVLTFRLCGVKEANAPFPKRLIHRHLVAVALAGGVARTV
jgi:hypothetical protein